VKEQAAIVPAFLQYGALGLLALVLLGVGFGFYFFLTYLKELIEVVRGMGTTAAAGLSRVEAQLESVEEALDRHQAEDRAQHTETRSLVLAKRSPYPFPNPTRGT
jgi:hypothetical protein